MEGEKQQRIKVRDKMKGTDRVSKRHGKESIKVEGVAGLTGKHGVSKSQKWKGGNEQSYGFRGKP